MAYAEYLAERCLIFQKNDSLSYIFINFYMYLVCICWVRINHFSAMQETVFHNNNVKKLSSIRSYISALIENLGICLFLTV